MYSPNNLKNTFTQQFLAETADIAMRMSYASVELIDAAIKLLVKTRRINGRLFILGVGGSAGNASHAVNDFRKLCNIEAYAPTDNVSELTARTNDEGWETTFVEYLKGSRLDANDTVLIFSVGGGNLDANVSMNLVKAMDYAKERSADVIAIVGRADGHAMKVADVCIVIPTVYKDRITPHSESFQAVIWHLFVSHPDMQTKSTKWEGLKATVPAFVQQVKRTPEEQARYDATKKFSDYISPARKRAIFFDRDGTLTKLLGGYQTPRTVSQMEIHPDAEMAVLTAAACGFLNLVVTNQPDISRGLISNVDAWLMADELTRKLRGLQRVYICPHTDQMGCRCRKPYPGLLHQAAAQYNVDLARSYMVGDTWRDVGAGKAAGCRTVLINRPEYMLNKSQTCDVPDAQVGSLAEAVAWILGDMKRDQTIR